MYSKGTINTLQTTINFGQKLKFFPFKLVINPNGIPELQQDTNKWQLILWKLSVVYFVVGQEIYLAVGIWFDLSYDIPIIQRAQFYILVPGFIMGISGLAIMLLSWEKMMHLFNLLLLFGHQLHKYHGTSKNRNDGIELPLKLFVATMCAAALISPLVTFTWLIQELHVWSILKGDINPISIMLCLGVPSVILADSSAVFLLVALAIGYVRVTEASLSKMIFTREKPLRSKQKQELINIYRDHQIYNNLANEEARAMVMIGISIGALIMIILSFALIGFSHILPAEVIIATTGPLILTFFVDYYCFGFSVKMTYASKAFPASFLHNDIMMRNVHRKCFKACKPLYVKIGDVAKIDKLTFPSFMNEVVITRVVDLLLMYR